LNSLLQVTQLQNNSIYKCLLWINLKVILQVNIRLVAFVPLLMLGTTFFAVETFTADLAGMDQLVCVNLPVKG